MRLGNRGFHGETQARFVHRLNPPAADALPGRSAWQRSIRQESCIGRSDHGRKSMVEYHNAILDWQRNPVRDHSKRPLSSAITRLGMHDATTSLINRKPDSASERKEGMNMLDDAHRAETQARPTHRDSREHGSHPASAPPRIRATPLSMNSALNVWDFRMHVQRLSQPGCSYQRPPVQRLCCVCPKHRSGEYLPVELWRMTTCLARAALLRQSERRGDLRSVNRGRVAAPGYQRSLPVTMLVRKQRAE